MLIGLLVGAMIAIFGGGQESEYATYIPKIKKEIKRHVEDQARKDSLLVIVKAYEKEIKKYEKKSKKTKKHMFKAAGDREVSTADFLEHYDAFFTASGEHLSTLINYRLSFQQQVTDEELILVAEKVYEEPKKKEQKKNKKEEDKIENKISKNFSQIKEVVIKDIEDPEKADHLTTSLGEFEAKVLAYLEEAKEIQKKRMKLLNNKNVSRVELDEIFAESNQIRYDASRLYARFREDAIQNTTPKEWKAIQKDIKLFIKG